MSLEKNNDLSEKINDIYNNNIEEKNESKESSSPDIEEQSNLNLDNSQNIPLEENEQNEQNTLKEDKLKSLTPFIMNPFYQILINKKMPLGYKLESEEILLKRDEKKHKNYLHRKHKKNSNSLLENKNDNENNNINNINNKNNEENKDNKNKDNNIRPRKVRRKSFHLGRDSLDNTKNKENKSIALRRMTRQYKPKIIEDLGYIDKDVSKVNLIPYLGLLIKYVKKE